MKNNRVIAIILTALIAYLLCIRFLLIFSWSTDLDGAEFGFVKNVQWLLHGKFLYSDPCAFPYFSTLYNPGYIYLLYYVSLLFKVHYLQDVHTIFVEARSISFLCMLINIYLIVKCLRLLGIQARFYLFLVALYLLLITGHFYVTRPDAIKTTLVTLIVYTVLQFAFYNGRWFFFLLFNIAVALAMLFKQDAAGNIILVTGCLIIFKPGKKAVMLLVSAAVNILLVQAILYACFGKYFFTNTVLFNLQQITDLTESYNLPVMLSSIGRTLPLFLLAVYTTYTAIKSGNKKDIEFYLPATAIAAFVVAHAGMLRGGSFINYSFEPLLLLILSLGILLKKHEQLMLSYTRPLLIVAGIYMAGIFVTNFIIHSYTYNAKAERQNKSDYFSTWQTKYKLEPIIGNDTVFLLNPKLTIFYEDKQLLLGYDFHLARMIQILVHWHLHSKLLFVSSSQYDSSFTNGTVKYIIADDNEVSKRLVAEEFEHYKQFTKVDGLLVYRFCGDALLND